MNDERYQEQSYDDQSGYQQGGDAGYVVARAIYDYEPQQDGDLPFVTGGIPNNI